MSSSQSKQLSGKLKGKGVELLIQSQPTSQGLQPKTSLTFKAPVESDSEDEEVDEMDEDSPQEIINQGFRDALTNQSTKVDSILAMMENLTT